MPDARAAFTARLMALSRAHDLLTEEQWVGADLVDVVRNAVAAFVAGGSDRIRMRGPPFRVSPRSALLLAMAVNELCTNAAKYGALSTPKGRVDVSWQIAVPKPGAEQQLQMRWIESGGPPVMPPTRRGFGSRLIENVLAAELEGAVTVAYEPSGLTCTISMPLSGIQEMKPHAA
jgi:two-component system CheB/CheR fusion protein